MGRKKLTVRLWVDGGACEGGCDEDYCRLRHRRGILTHACGVQEYTWRCILMAVTAKPSRRSQYELRLLVAAV